MTDDSSRIEGFNSSERWLAQDSRPRDAATNGRVSDGVSLPSPQDYQNTMRKAEAKAKELLSPYEQKCAELQVT